MKLSKLSLLLLLLIPLFPAQVFSNQILRVAVGIGIPELPSVSLRAILGNTEIGVTAGKLTDHKDDAVSYSADVYQYFRNHKTKQTDIIWYGRIGINYFKNETKSSINEYIYFNPRLGLEIKMNQNFGFEVDGGVFYQLKRDEKEKNPSESDFDLDLNFRVLPSLGARLYYKF